MQDEESYIYLSAINTLAALALVHTDEVLPILIESFNDKHRAEMDRLKVGQVIVSLRLVNFFESSDFIKSAPKAVNLIITYRI